MGPDEFYYLGKILKRHGNQGHLVALVEVDDAEDYKELESVYVDVGHERIPFFIDSVEVAEKKKLILRFQDVTTADHADVFAGHELYLPLSALPKLDGKRFYFHEVKGFKVVDEKYGDIGFIEDVLDLPQQALFQIRHQDKEILIPVVDEVILKVDRKTQTMHIHAPDGLIELYTT
ncbi:MAG: 16S rRNA processing protein RimM [Bacteroidales bacterium]|nr:16S rRNA processing protein RimM [Bacteroidales bacterium]